MAQGELKAAEFPCEPERVRSLRCAEQFKSELFRAVDDEKKAACQALFDAYKDCRAKVQEDRKVKNNGGKPMTFFPS